MYKVCLSSLFKAYYILLALIEQNTANQINFTIIFGHIKSYTKYFQENSLTWKCDQAESPE